MKPETMAVSERGKPATKASARSASRERGLDRVVELFAHLHRVGHPVSIGDLARALSAPRSTLYGLVRILTDAGLLESVGPRGEVFFGKSLYFYGMDFLRQHDVLGRARAEVDRLARETGETVQLCVLHERKYFSRLHECGPAAVPHQFGDRRADPAALDSLGKAAAVRPFGRRDPGLRAGRGLASATRGANDD